MATTQQQSGGATRPGQRLRQNPAVTAGLILGLAAAGSCDQAAAPDEVPTTVAPVTTSALPPGFAPLGPPSYVAKVKTVLTGLPATDAEVQAVSADPQALRRLVDGWMQSPEFQARMLRFFRNAFQQGQLGQANLVDQLGGMGVSGRLLNNIMDSFALTAWQLTMVEGKPLTDTLTTDRYMLTPPLAMLLGLIDNRNIDDKGRTIDRIAAANRDFTVTLSNSAGAIALDDTLNPASPLFMHWYLPTMPATGCVDPIVYKGDTLRLYLYLTGSVSGIAMTCPQGFNTPPQFVDSDYDAWRMVRLRQPAAGEAVTPFYDVKAMRSASELVMRIPRYGFFGTPAFAANWSTNPSNQARVTMNQTLIVGLGRSFDDTNNTVPLTSPALDGQHAADPACYACHKTLDPMRQVFRQAYSLAYHEQTDPAQLGLHGVFAVDGVTKDIGNLRELGAAMASHPRFAIAWTQKLCYWANSASCSETDPEFQRVAARFADSGFDWKTLVRELLTSPLTTGASDTLTFAEQGQTISVARRDQLCAGLASRLGVPNLCALGRAPSLAQLVPSDGYSRGSTAPVLATDPSLFYRAATEQLCRVFADYVVDTTVAGKPSRYSSKSPDAAIDDLLASLMGIVPTDPRRPALRQILGDHFAKAKATAGLTLTDALKSTFLVACTAPTSISIGL